MMNSQLFKPITVGFLAGTAILAASCYYYYYSCHRKLSPLNTPSQHTPHHNTPAGNTHSSPLQNHHVSDVIKEEEENQFRLMINRYLSLMNSKRYVDAEVVLTEMVAFVEENWGKRHMNYGLLMGITCAGFFKVLGNNEKMEECLKESYHILAVQSPEVLAESGILDGLISFYTEENNQSEAAKYLIISIDNRRAIFKQNVTKEGFNSFCNYVLKNWDVFTKVGLFKRSEVLFKELIRIGIDMLPEEHIFYYCLEAYTNIFHQQGKTFEAIHELEQYSERLTRIDVAKSTVMHIYRRIGILYYIKELYEDAEKQFCRAKQLAIENSIKIPINLLCEIASVEWELGKTEEAKKTQLLMETIELIPQDTPPLTRSKYLSTIVCCLKYKNNLAQYSLALRVNRESPHRKEGDTDVIKRRLESCYLSIQFENTGPNCENLTKTMEVSGENVTLFNIESAILPFEKTGKRYYEVVIEIFEDKMRTKKIGKHHQLITTQGD